MVRLQDHADAVLQAQRAGAVARDLEAAGPVQQHQLGGGAVLAAAPLGAGPAVADLHHPVHVALDVAVVGDQDRRRVHLPEQVDQVLEQAPRGGAVQLGGRLDRQQQPGPVGQRDREREREPLRLLAGERRRAPAADRTFRTRLQASPTNALSTSGAVRHLPEYFGSLTKYLFS